MSSSPGADESPESLIARHGAVTLFAYHPGSTLPPHLAPRPYFHPLRTLTGAVVTEHQPRDHAWHLGLAYSWPVVNSWNFWGGPTFSRDQLRYLDLDNHGRIRHLDWAGAVEQLEWLDPDGERIATETRSFATEVDEGRSLWWLTLQTVIENRGPTPLRLGSPTTEGRPLAGYAGLAWRGSERMRAAQVVTDGSSPDPEPMGKRSRWLACVGEGATVAFIEEAKNPGAPNRWFVRTQEYPLVTSSPVFDQPLALGPGDALRLGHTMLVADGRLDAAALHGLLDSRGGTGGRGDASAGTRGSDAAPAGWA